MERTFFIILFIYSKEKTRINNNEIKINGKTRKKLNYKNQRIEPVCIYNSTC